MDVSLRMLEPGDMDALFEMESDPVGWHMVAFAEPGPRDRAAFDAHWQRVLAAPGAIVRAILLGGGFAGTVMCFVRGSEREVGFWIRRPLWGRGIAGAALRALLSAVAERPLFARCAADNLGSRRVIERAGFVRLREERWTSHARGGEIDECVYVLRGAGGDVPRPSPDVG